MANRMLNKAKGDKKDEFYTRLTDIENELGHYDAHFKNKTVYLNCDDPRYSQFWTYFTKNFKRLGLTKLYATYYIGDKEEEVSFSYEARLEESGELLVTKTGLKEDGDFRGKESLGILEQSDIVVTNPPFSLWRPFIQTMEEYNKQFIVLGRQTAVGYRDIFPLLRDGKMWVGVNSNKVMKFLVPDSYELIEGKYTSDEEGNNYIIVPALSWYTNLEHTKRYKDLPLTRSYVEDPSFYPTYTNYPAVNVNRLQYLPYDYYGEMGVPITILNHLNPKQFEITGFRKGLDGKDLTYDNKVIYTRVLIKRLT